MAFKIANLKTRDLIAPRTQSILNEAIDDLGFFDNLPPEIFFRILKFLPIDAIGKLALTSDSLRMKIIDWIFCPDCQKRTRCTFDVVYSPDFEVPGFDPNQSTALNTFLKSLPRLEKFGILAKRLTCLSFTRDRVGFAFAAFERTLYRHGILIETQIEKGDLKNLSRDWLRSIHFIKLMRLVHTFTKGWENVELIGVFQQLDQSFGISSDISSVSHILKR